LATTRHSGESRNPLDNTVGLDTGLRRYDVRKFPQLKSIILGKIIEYKQTLVPWEGAAGFVRINNFNGVAFLILKD
jgi:hypothetical protein